MQLQKNKAYLTKNNDIIYILYINNKNKWAAGICIHPELKTLSYYLAFFRYYSLDGEYNSNINYNITKELTKFNKEYRKYNKIIKSIEHFIDSEKEVMKEFSIFFIPKEY